MTKLDVEELNFLLTVADLYYEQGLTQAEIGRKLETSRSTISRALQEAKRQGLVEITIHHELAQRSQLEHELQSLFNLKTVHILADPSEDIIDDLGKLAADYLTKHTQNNMILGMSYGRSVAATIRHTTAKKLNNIIVVQILGALGSTNPLIESPELSRELAYKFGGTYRYLYTPLLVEDSRTRDLLIEEPMVQDVLAIGRQANIALLGIGSLNSSMSHLWMGYLNKEALLNLQNQGAVGHMCAEFFDAHGSIMNIPSNKHSISIGLNALKNIDTVIAVAGGKEKSQAILGALRGGYIDVLITDQAAAEGIMRYVS